MSATLTAVWWIRLISMPQSIAGHDGAILSLAADSWMRHARPMADRDRIIASLTRERTELEARYRAFGDDVLDTPCTPSEDPDGRDWTPRDHLAHLLRIEVAFLEMARSTIDGDTDPVRIPGASVEDKLRAVHRANEEHVDEHRGRTVDELLDELGTARADTLAFLDELTDQQLDLPIPGAPWGDGSIGSVLRTNAYHERQHLAWVDEALAALADDDR